MSIEVTPAVAGASGKSQASIAKYDDGTLTGESQDVRSFIASAAIVAGEVVILAPPTASTNVQVARVPAGAAGTIGRKVVGVALNSAAAGNVVKVACDYGWVRGTGTADQGVQATATAGVVGTAASASTPDVQFGDCLVATTAGVFPSVTTPATNATTTGIFVRFYGSA